MNKKLLKFDKFKCRKKDKGEQFIHPDESYSSTDFRHVSISCDINWHKYSQFMTLILNIRHWLELEIKEHQDCADAHDNGEEPIMSDNTDEICVGRHECAESLLNMIGQWENEMAFDKIHRYVDWQYQEPEEQIDHKKLYKTKLEKG